MKIFIDVDNTILEHSGFYSIETESRIHSSIGKFPHENENAIKTMYESAICRNPDIVKKLLFLDNVYILTKYPAIEYEIHKQLRMAEILEISHEELMNLKDSNGNIKYICIDTNSSKVQTVKEMFDIADLSDCILVDDYSYNLIEWENNGGIAIKYYNEYNSPNHPIKGLSISNFKIFTTLLENKSINDLLVSCEDSYMLNLFVKLLNDKANVEYLDILHQVYLDLISKLKVEKMNINSKYNIRSFLIEYYGLMESLNPNYWSSKIKNEINNNCNLSLICASFDTDLRKLNIFENEDNLALKIIEKKESKTTNIYDVYLTLDENAFLTSIDETLNNLIEILNKFILKDDC
ncbi:hypothetical protein OKW22_000976 [Bacilli bacterium PM5-3]|nr:hypothetical protein [Bacilli bacterium PM5-3]MDH6603031.1 hypothetical protein [Bacilli bacterium PM5-9]